MHLKKLSEQVIVITGVSSGIGRATAKMAAKRGTEVVLTALTGLVLFAGLTAALRMTR